MESSNSNQSFLKIAIVTLLFAGISLAILSLFMGENTSKFIAKFMSICFITLFFGLLASLSFGASVNENTRVLSLVSIIVCLVGFILASLLIIFETKSPGLVRTTFALFVSGIALTQICRLYKINIVNKFAYMSRVAASVCITLFTSIIIMLIFSTDIEAFSLFRSNPLSETSGRSFSSLFALDFAFTAATPLLNKLDYGKYETEDIEEEFLKEVVD